MGGGARGPAWPRFETRATTPRVAAPQAPRTLPARSPRRACRRRHPPEPGARSTARSSPSAASSTPSSQTAAFRPKVVGTACWVSVRPAISVERFESASRSSASTWMAISRRTRSRASRRQRTRRCRARPGWSGRGAATLRRPPPQPGLAARASSGGTGLPLDSDCSASISMSPGPTRSTEAHRSVHRGRSPESTRALSQASSTRTIASTKRGARHHLTGAVVARPVEVAHRRSYDKNTVSSLPCRWMSKRRPWSSRAAISVARRSGSAPRATDQRRVLRGRLARRPG